MDQPKTTTPSTPTETSMERDYFFPTEGVTIKATSKEEAETKLVELSKKI